MSLICKLIWGDSYNSLRKIKSDSIHCVITSPPYYKLRDYKYTEQIGQEETSKLYIKRLVKVFDEVYRVLREDGTLWINIGDTYGKNKSLMGIPWKLAFALKKQGWILRQDIIWNKPNCVPESTKDRCTKSHEYIFLLTKSSNYFFDNQAIKEKLIYNSDVAYRQQLRTNKIYNSKEPYKNNLPRSFDLEAKNRRSVWSIKVKPSKDSHIAVFPLELPTLCLKAGVSEKGCCKKCGKQIKRRTKIKNGAKIYKWKKTCECKTDKVKRCWVLDPFGGSGSTNLIAYMKYHNSIYIDAKLEYCKIAYRRLSNRIGIKIKRIKY